MAKAKAHAKKGGSAEVADMLSQLLADSFVIYVKTQNFHWNVQDPRFYPLHKMWQEQYEELATANDVIAEQIRQIGHLAPGSMAEFLKLSTLKESGNQHPADKMLKELLADHDKVIEYLPEMIERSTELHDHATADLLIDRLRAHSKAAWFLRAHFA